MSKTEHKGFFEELLRQNNLLLAPLAGVTDAAFRQICFEEGAQIMFTEMISAKGIVYGNENTIYLAKLFPGECNTAIQLFGSQAEFMAKAIQEFVNNSSFAFLDINMGCPVKKIVGNGEGSALLRDSDKLYKLMKAVVEECDKPVSAKIRLGIDGVMNAEENACALEEAGVGMITVHGRSREMYYSGKADYEQIARVEKAVGIPVVANGDVHDYESYKTSLAVTGAQGVMIGRAAMGNPFIFRQILSQIRGENLKEPTREERLSTALKHFHLLCDYKGEYIACNEFRKHLCYYTKGMPGGAALRERSSKLSSPEEFTDFINGLLASPSPEA